MFIMHIVVIMHKVYYYDNHFLQLDKYGIVCANKYRLINTNQLILITETLFSNAPIEILAGPLSLEDQLLLLYFVAFLFLLVYAVRIFA